MVTIISTGAFVASALSKTREHCIAPFNAELSFQFAALPGPVDFFSVEAYKGHGLAPYATPIYSATLPGTVTQFSLQIDLIDEKDYTLRITAHKIGTASSFIIIEDVIKT